MIRTLAAGVLLASGLGGLLTASAGQKEKAQPDPTALKQLEGTYSAVTVSKGGKAATDEYVQGTSLRITKDELVFVTKDPMKERRYPARITRLDPKATPAIIDIQPTDGPDNKKTFSGIYSYSDGVLTLAFTERGERPKDFSGDNDATVMKLQKAGVKKKDDKGKK